MTDKEIIIDGVDVSECEFYSSSENCLEFNGKYTIDICDSAKCSNNPNCYFKQLKHKEQECERLKWYLKEIRYDELKALDIEWDEYETHCIDSEYSNIINLVEEALKERSSEDCRYDR